MAGNESHYLKIHIFEVGVSPRTSSECGYESVRANPAPHRYDLQGGGRGRGGGGGDTSVKFLIFNFAPRPAAHTAAH